MLGLKFESYISILYNLGLFKRKMIKQKLTYNVNEDAFNDWATLKKLDIKIKRYQKKSEGCRFYIRIGTFEKDNDFNAETQIKENIQPPPFLPYQKFTYVLGNKNKDPHIKDTFATNEKTVSSISNNIKDTLPPATNSNATGTKYDSFTSAFLDLIKHFFP